MFIPVFSLGECDSNASFNFQPTPILALKWKILAFARTSETEGETFWSRSEYFFLSWQGMLLQGLTYAFITSIPRHPTSIWLSSNHATERPLTGHLWHWNWSLGIFQCYFIWTLSIIWPCSPLLSFWSSSSFTWITLYSCFPWFYQNFLFKHAVPKYSLWPLLSITCTQLGNFCSLTNSCLSLKGHEAHFRRLPFLDVPAWYWTIHD